MGAEHAAMRRAEGRLGDKEAVGAFSNAQKEFENYSRNSGQVKDLLEKVDKGFLKVADSARSSGSSSTTSRLGGRGGVAAGMVRSEGAGS